MSNEISILTWNIRNPSLERAKLQSIWFENRNEDIFVLTEIKNSKGCIFLKDFFISKGFYVIFPDIKGRDYGSMLVSKFPISLSFKNLDYQNFKSPRVSFGEILFHMLSFNLVGIYVPSRDRSEEKIKRKRFFIDSFMRFIQEYKTRSPMIICGDLNVLELNHVPKYPIFSSWEYDFYNFFIGLGMVDAWKLLNKDKIEYSWVGRTGNGYRYDYFFIDKTLIPFLSECNFIHQPREDKLSDHSALYIKLNIT